MPAWQIWAILGLLAVCGLRDKVLFLAARGEIYGSLAVCFLLSGTDMIVAAKVVFLVIWIGAATCKLNKHSPFVMSTMASNSPMLRPRIVKRRFFAHFPDDLRPGRLSWILAHVGTAAEIAVPLMLFFSHGGWVSTAAAIVMIGFHVSILTAIPMGAPLEWNVFMIFGVLWLFVAHADLGLADLAHPAPVVLLFAVIAGTVVLGNFFPHKISSLAGMRY